MPVALHARRWVEHERGWGSRPDGITLHASYEESERFVKEYNTKWNSSPVVPDEYSVAGEDFLMEVSQELHDHILATGTIWFTDSERIKKWAPKPAGNSSDRK